MKKIEIFDPAMCCATGVCGPSVDTDLLRVATMVEALKKQGIDITRHNLANEPQAFITNKTVNDLLMQDNDILPVTLVDGEVVKTKAHLTNDEFAKYTGMVMAPASTSEPCCSQEKIQVNNAPCCGRENNCC